MVPTFTMESIDEGGARLDPDSIATPTPQFFDVASPPDRQTGFGVGPHRTSGTGHALHTGPYPSGLSRLWTYGASDSGSSRTPSHHCLPDPSRLTVPTRPVRCQGCSHHRVRSHVLVAPSFTDQLRLTGGEVLTPPLDSRRLVAHVRSARGALPVFPPVGFPEPPPAPAVPVSGQRALHKSRCGSWSAQRCSLA
jgi:hypothetical protein